MKNTLPTKVFYPVLLTGIVLLLLLLPLGTGMFFGSEGDWYSQHVGIAESIRQTMLETGCLIPQYIHLGGGSSIYDFSYYGLLRPDILISCLMPDVDMKYIIAGYAVLEMIAGVNLCYLWVLGQNIQNKIAFAGAVLFCASTCFFHAHHQIMFVNFLPFLLLALMGVDRLFQKNRCGLLIVSLFFIYIHSYYYSISCLVVVLVYAAYHILQNDTICEMAKKREWNRLIVMLNGRIGKLIFSVILSITMAMVLLLPTGLAILSTHKDSGGFVKTPQRLVDFGLSGLLYSPYGCGMTLITLYCLLFSFKRKGKRFLAVCLLLVISLPVISYVLNGFLYSRAKILIPFVTLLVFLTADTLQEIYKEGYNCQVIPLLLSFVPIFFSAWKPLVLIDGLLLFTWLSIQWNSKICLTVKQKTFWLVLVVPLLISLGVNMGDSYLKPVCKKLGIPTGTGYLKVKDNRQQHFTNEDIECVVSDSRYRFDILVDNFVNCNLLADGSINKTAMYSSVTNADYAEFYYDTMKNAISLNNRVALVPGKNPCFSYIMGMRYVLTVVNDIPHGYKTLLQKGDYVLAENEDVLPVCYGTTDIMSSENYEELKFPHTLEALCQNAVVEKKEEKVTTSGVKGKKTAFISHVKREDPEDIFCREDVQTLMQSFGVKKTFTLPFKQSLKGKILIISFHVESKKGQEVVITINGTKNKLSAKTAPYPNKNNEFTYVLTMEDENELTVKKSKGEYILDNLTIYTIDQAYLRHSDITVPVAEQQVEYDGEDVFTGRIHMKEDGYFITSCPYKKGYKIMVDGMPVEYEKVNTAFIGFPIEAGEHRIEITYEAPGFRIGNRVSILAFIAFGLLILWEKDANDSSDCI